MGNRATQFYPFALAAGGTDVILAEGGYYRIISSTGALQVRQDGGSSLSPLYAGQGQRKEFKRLTITDKSGSANNGVIIVADDDFIDDRITGEVSVIDGELARSKAGNAFEAYGAVGNVAGQYPYMELWNAPGSGKRAIVSDVMFSSGGVAGIAVYTLQRTTANVSAATGAPSKSSVGALSVSKIGSGTFAAIPGSGLEPSYVIANSPLSRQFKQPFVMEPGSGLIVINAQVNTNMYSTFQFIEETI